MLNNKNNHNEYAKTLCTPNLDNLMLVYCIEVFMVYRNIHGEEGSFWMETCPTTDFPSLDKDLKVDTVILGEEL